MKKIIYLYVILLSATFTNAQIGLLETAILPGTLTVEGDPLITQTMSELVMEAGENDNIIGLETGFDISVISFILDSSTNFGITIPSDQLCGENVFRYTVYMHTKDAPDFTEIQARSIENGGERVPGVALYDDLPIRPLGDRDLTTQNGGNFITIPDDGDAAIKVFEFIGCRQNIPIQFKIKPSVKAKAGDYDKMKIFYTVVGSIL